jgi:glycosyltransferase involved in cell wall biosynthesis
MTDRPRPVVSVVVPVFNGAAFVAEALRSVLAQTYRPLDVVAVDDGSSDESAAIVASFAHVRCVRQPNRGVAAARNAGVAATSGPLVAFIDQDDRWTPDKLTRQVTCLEKHPHLGFCLAHQRLVLEPGTGRPSWLRPELLAADPVGYLPGTLLVWRETLHRVGLFDEANPIASDSDWFLRAKDAGIAMAVLPEVLLERRIHRANQSAQTVSGSRQLLAAVRRSIRRQHGEP